MSETYRGDAAHDYFLHDADYHYKMCFDSECAPIDTEEREHKPTPRESALRALVSDWQANGNSRGLGDPTDHVWFACAQQLLAVLDARE